MRPRMSPREVFQESANSYKHRAPAERGGLCFNCGPCNLFVSIASGRTKWLTLKQAQPLPISFVALRQFAKRVLKLRTGKLPNSSCANFPVGRFRQLTI